MEWLYHYQTTVEDNVAMEKSGTRDTIKESCILLWKGSMRREEIQQERKLKPA